MLRMNNIQAEGWVLDDLKYVDLEPDEVEKYRLDDGDLVFNRTNSKELVGKSEVFRQGQMPDGYGGPVVYASYLIRVALDQEQAMPDFVSSFLDTPAGRLQIDRVSRQIAGMTNINGEELRQLVVPLPPVDHQRRLAAELDDARASWRRKHDEADGLLAGLGGYLMDALGLVLPERERQLTFAVPASALFQNRVDPPAHQPFAPREYPPGVALRPLSDIAAINANPPLPPAADDAPVPYVGLPECSQTEVLEVDTRPYASVRSRNVAVEGDILFARIEPSVFNQKYVLIEDLKGHEAVATSTEFYTVRAKPGEVDQRYLYAMFFCPFVFDQVRGKTTGSSGRRRIDKALFGRLQIPVPDRGQQVEIAGEVVRRRERARQLRAEAAREWAAARAVFEARLVGEPAAPQP